MNTKIVRRSENVAIVVYKQNASAPQSYTAPLDANQTMFFKTFLGTYEQISPQTALARPSRFHHRQQRDGERRRWGNAGISRTVAAPRRPVSKERPGVLVTAALSRRSTPSPLPPPPLQPLPLFREGSASAVPADRCDLRPSSVALHPSVSPSLPPSLRPIRPSTSCSPASWPSSPPAAARAPPGPVCSVFFFSFFFFFPQPSDGCQPSLDALRGRTREGD